MLPELCAWFYFKNSFNSHVAKMSWSDPKIIGSFYQRSMISQIFSKIIPTLSISYDPLNRTVEKPTIDMIQPGLQIKSIKWQWSFCAMSTWWVEQSRNALVRPVENHLRTRRTPLPTHQVRNVGIVVCTSAKHWYIHICTCENKVHITCFIVWLSNKQVKVITVE